MKLSVSSSPNSSGSTGASGSSGKAAADRDWFIPEDGRKQLTQLFAKLPNPVVLDVFTDGDDKNAFNGYTLRFAEDISLIVDKISMNHHALDSEEAKRRGVTLSPTMFVGTGETDPALDYRIRFTGAPLGEEGRALVESIFLVSLRQSGLTETSRRILSELKEPRKPRVFTSPGCPYCPGQFMHAAKCAIERPGLVEAECVNSDEFPDLSKRFQVGSVPHTQYDDTHKAIGLLPEERFVLEMVTLKSAEELMREHGMEPGHEGHDHAHGAHGAHGMDPEGLDVVETDMVVLGAGPAGLSAAIYAERSGMKTVVLDKAVVGGQVTVTPVVENYPGFTDIAGLKLVEVLSAHARQYATVRENEAVHEIKIGKFLEVYTNRAVYLCKALVFATGAQWRKLDAPGEARFYGRGVSYCASCDGFMYRGKRVAMIGGGNSALTDALHLKNLGAEVTVIHRRDSFRAEKALQDSLAREGIAVIWDTVVEEVLGDTVAPVEGAGGDGKEAKAAGTAPAEADAGVVRGIRVRNVKTGDVSELPFDGVFVAIGHIPNSEQAAELGVVLEKDGSIKVDRHMRTNIPRIYAAGDVTGGVRQIVTAVGSGATAALAAFEDTQNPYWKKKGE